MLKYDKTYSQYNNGPSDDYPNGSANNATGEDNIDGTPYVAGFFNDVIGFFQAVFYGVNGRSAKVSGNSETANASDVWSAIKKHVSDSDETVKNSLETKITDEETARKSADSALETKITDEETARKSADSALETKITDEETARKSADDNLGERIDALSDLGIFIPSTPNGGRNLVSVLGASTVAQAGAKLKQMSDSKNYAGLRLGDYLEFPVSGLGSGNLRFEIVSFDQYNWFWDNNAEAYGLGNIVFLCTTCPITRQIGTPTSQRTYFTSPLDTFLTGLVKTIEAQIGTTLKQPTLCQQYNDNTYNDPSWNTDPTDDWETASDFSRKVFLPSIREFTGEKGFGSENYDNSRQFPLLAIVPNKAVECLTDNVQTEWTRTPSRNPGNFCGMDRSGNSYDYYASNARGVRPAFCL